MQEQELINLKNDIEKMDKHNQIRILKILTESDKVSDMLTENRNGTFVNLTTLPSDVIQKIIQYTNFVKNQEQYLNIQESQKKEMLNKLNLT